MKLVDLSLELYDGFQSHGAFIEDGPTIERVPPETLLGPAVVLDATPYRTAGEPATAATLARLR